MSLHTVPELCPVCLGSGLIMGLGGGTAFVPVWRGIRSGYSVKCGRCDGKGWLADRNMPTSSDELEVQIVHEILKEHSIGLNIDDIARLSKLDVPTVYRALQSLRDKGVISVKTGSPIIYHIATSNP